MNSSLFHYFFSKVPVVSFNYSGKIIEVNNSFLAFLGLKKESIINKRIYTLFSLCQDKKYARKNLKEAKNSLIENKKWEGIIYLSQSIKEQVGIVAMSIEDSHGKFEKFSIMLHREFNCAPYKTKDDAIKKGLANKDFVLYFQPLECIKTGKIKKYEALLRMKKEGIILTPYQFLEKMKRSPSYDLLTAYVIEEAVFYISIFHVCIAINLSMSDLKKHHKKLLNIFDEKPLIPHYLTIEILEDEIFSFENNEELMSMSSFLKDMKKRGVSIAVDDFGVKHSNWNRFLEIEPDILKIDGSLIKNIQNNKYMIDAIVSLVDFAKKHDIETVAEFVENQELLNIVKSIGIDYAQGYFIGKPKPANEVFGNAIMSSVKTREREKFHCR